MAVEQRVTVCRICEAHCGMVATVEDGVVTKLRPDKDHPLSAGEACPKGIAMTDVQNDPDRVIHPLRRTGDGSFERISWESALAEIGERLRAIIGANGPQSVGWYFGNPGAFSYSHAALGEGLRRRARHAALLHGVLAGRGQPLRGERAALRLADAAADP